MTGYAIQLGPKVYDSWRDGRPFTLAEAWAETYGVGGATLIRPNGTVMLESAGNVSTRVEVGDLGRHQRSRSRLLRRGSAMYADAVAGHKLYHPTPRRELP